MPDNEQDTQHSGVSRRSFLRGLGVAGASTTLAADLLLPNPSEAAPAPPIRWRAGRR